MKPKFFQLAKTASKHSNHPQHQLGAVIVYKNKVVSLGFNKMQTHPKSGHPWSYSHAEFCAVIKAQRDLKDCHIYIYRETRDGIPGLAKPCNSCMAMIAETGISKIHYSTDAGYVTIET